MLRQLGLLEAKANLERGHQPAPRLERRAARHTAAAAVAAVGGTEARRTSKRLRGEPALSQDAACAAAQAELADDEAFFGPRRQVVEVVPPHAAYAAPFTLLSIGVTVLDLGHVHRGPWAERYWSSAGSLYHHTFPVGYRATKVVFGRTYEMSIEEGSAGPLFKVVNQKTGVSFSGPSPTKPWTDVCISHRTGMRISGPQFFGFSDAITQCAIASLYTAEELEAVRRGERLRSSKLSSEEHAAREFEQQVPGVGEATARALALTTQLGGGRHGSLASLQRWVQASEAHALQLRQFLLTSTELPGGTRRWPAWRQHTVPRIVSALTAGVGASGGRRTRGKTGGQQGSRQSKAAAASKHVADTIC